MPRNKDHAHNCPAKLGTAILLSYLDLKNEFSPFDEKEPSLEHYQSNPEFQKLNYRTWYTFASKLIHNARLLIPNDLHYQKVREANKISDTASELRSEPMTPNRAGPPKKQATPGKTPTRLSVSRVIPPHTIGIPKTQPSDLNDIFVVQYDNPEVLFVRIDIDGDVTDASAHKIEFSAGGMCLTYSSRIPQIMLDSSLMFAGMADDYVFKNLFEAEISKRKQQHPEIASNGMFELRKSVRLPYPVEQKFYNSSYQKMDMYKIYINGDGAAFTFFWLKKIN